MSQNWKKQKRKPWQQQNETSKAKTLQPQQMKNEELGSN
jgi:hypothetical protein